VVRFPAGLRVPSGRQRTQRSYLSEELCFVVVMTLESGFWKCALRTADDKVKFVGHHNLQVPLRNYVAMMSQVPRNDVSQRVHCEGVVARDSCSHPGVRRQILKEGDR